MLTPVYYPNSTSQSLRIHDIHSLCSRSWPILPPLLKSHASVLPSVPILRTCGWVQYGPIIEALYNDLFLSEDFIWVPMLKVIWVDLVHVDSESAGRLETRGSPSSIEAIDLFFCFFVFSKMVVCWHCDMNRVSILRHTISPRSPPMSFIWALIVWFLFLIIGCVVSQSPVCDGSVCRCQISLCESNHIRQSRNNPATRCLYIVMPLQWGSPVPCRNFIAPCADLGMSLVVYSEKLK